MFVKGRRINKPQYMRTTEYYTAVENNPAHRMGKSQKRHTECKKMHVDEIQMLHTGPGQAVPGGSTGDRGDCDAFSLDLSARHI